MGLRPKSLFSLGKAGFAALLASVLWLSGYTVWLALRDPVDYGSHHSQSVRQLTGEQVDLEKTLIQENAHKQALLNEVIAQEARQKNAEKTRAELHELRSWWKVMIETDEQRQIREREARMEQMRDEAKKRTEELKQEIIRSTWVIDGVEIALNQKRIAVRTAQTEDSAIHYYWSQAWSRSKWYIMGAVTLWMLAVWALLAVIERSDRSEV